MDDRFFNWIEREFRFSNLKNIINILMVGLTI